MHKPRNTREETYNLLLNRGAELKWERRLGVEVQISWSVETVKVVSVVKVDRQPLYHSRFPIDLQRSSPFVSALRGITASLAIGTDGVDGMQPIRDGGMTPERARAV